MLILLSTHDKNIQLNELENAWTIVRSTDSYTLKLGDTHVRAAFQPPHPPPTNKIELLTYFVCSLMKVNFKAIAKVTYGNVHQRIRLKAQYSRFYNGNDVDGGFRLACKGVLYCSRFSLAKNCHLRNLTTSCNTFTNCLQYFDLNIYF